jgi:NADH pyrophosphatase NudC (nudix superfamily)
LNVSNDKKYICIDFLKLKIYYVVIDKNNNSFIGFYSGDIKDFDHSKYKLMQIKDINDKSNKKIIKKKHPRITTMKEYRKIFYKISNTKMNKNIQLFEIKKQMLRNYICPRCGELFSYNKMLYKCNNCQIVISHEDYNKVLSDDNGKEILSKIINTRVPLKKRNL